MNGKVLRYYFHAYLRFCTFYVTYDRDIQSRGKTILLRRQIIVCQIVEDRHSRQEKLLRTLYFERPESSFSSCSPPSGRFTFHAGPPSRYYTLVFSPISESSGPLYGSTHPMWVAPPLPPPLFSNSKPSHYAEVVLIASLLHWLSSFVSWCKGKFSHRLYGVAVAHWILISILLRDRSNDPGSIPGTTCFFALWTDLGWEDVWGEGVLGE